MDFGQILQVVLSLAVVAAALYLSARMARRRFGGAPGEDALRVVSRQAVSRTQNLVVVEAGGQRHLVAFTDGGAHTVRSWEAPEPQPEPAGPAHAAPRPTVSDAFASRLASLTAGTQWSGLGARSAGGTRSAASSTPRGDLAS